MKSHARILVGIAVLLPVLILSIRPGSLELSATAAGAGQEAGKAQALLPHPNGYVCYRAARPLQIDGRLDEADWANAPWTEEFVDIEGDKRPRPRFRTRAKMLWDDTYFYVAAFLDEPHVWATLTAHDSVIFQDNDFEIFIDPDGDNHEYYELEINALNTEWDLFLPRPYKDGGRAMNSWEIHGLKTAVHIMGTLNNPQDTDKGWSVEFAIPWKVLAEAAGRPAPPKEGDQWRVNFSRVEWLHEIVGGKYRKVPNRPEDNWVWAPQGAINMHRPESWGYVQFSRAKPGTDALRPDPAWPARQVLIHAYYAQHEFRAKRGRWAKNLEELGLAGFRTKDLARPPRLAVTEAGFEVTAEIEYQGKLHHWRIVQDSRIWEQ